MSEKPKRSDAPAIAAIILPVIREAATYALDPDMSEAEALTYWMGPEKETFVAEESGAVLGHLLHAAKSGRRRAARMQLRLHDLRHSNRTGGCAAHVRAFAGVLRSCVIARCSSTL